MKRITILLAVPLSLVLLAAASDSTITVRPSDMKSGETKVLTDDGRKITIRRDGDKVYVTIDGVDGTKRVIVTEGDDGVRIEREVRRKVMKDVQKQMKEQRFLMDDFVMPKIEIPPIEIPKIEVPNVRPLIPHRTWFECPKDHTMLRVPEGKENETFKCPVDGTTMEKKKGSGWAYFYSDDESDDF